MYSPLINVTNMKFNILQMRKTYTRTLSKVPTQHCELEVFTEAKARGGVRMALCEGWRSQILSCTTIRSHPSCKTPCGGGSIGTRAYTHTHTSIKHCKHCNGNHILYKISKHWRRRRKRRRRPYLGCLHNYRIKKSWRKWRSFIILVAITKNKLQRSQTHLHI